MTHTYYNVMPETEIKSDIKQYYAYKHLWKPVINKHLNVAMEPGNLSGKYAAFVKKDKVVVGHLPLGETGRIANLISCFLRANIYANCNVVIPRREVSLGNGEGMQVSCLLYFTRTKQMLDLLKRKLFLEFWHYIKI